MFRYVVLVVLGIAPLVSFVPGTVAQTAKQDSTKLSDMMFTLEPPAGWEVRLQVTLIEPASIHNPISGPPPRANVVISRLPATSATARAACEDFLQNTTNSLAQAKVEEIVPFTFQDRVEGVAVQISFAATPQIRLVQVHAFRIDGNVQTQLVATLSESDSANRRKAMENMLKKFQP